MYGSLLTEGIFCECVIVAFDHLEVLFDGKNPEIPLFETDAAVAFSGSLDFRVVDFKNEASAVAVAPVGFNLCRSHSALSAYML